MLAQFPTTLAIRAAAQTLEPLQHKVLGKKEECSQNLKGLNYFRKGKYAREESKFFRSFSIKMENLLEKMNKDPLDNPGHIISEIQGVLKDVEEYLNANVPTTFVDPSSRRPSVSSMQVAYSIQGTLIGVLESITYFLEHTPQQNTVPVLEQMPPRLSITIPSPTLSSPPLSTGKLSPVALSIIEAVEEFQRLSSVGGTPRSSAAGSPRISLLSFDTTVSSDSASQSTDYLVEVEVVAS